MATNTPVFEINNGVTTYRDNEGRIHNDDGPAVVYNLTDIKHYYQHGVLHRLDGPAIEHNDPAKCTYAVNGFICDKSNFQDRVERYLSEQLAERLDGTEPVNTSENMYLDIPGHPEISFVIIVENGVVLSSYSIHDTETGERLYAEQIYQPSLSKEHLLERINNAIYESDCLNWIDSEKVEIEEATNTDIFCESCGAITDEVSSFTIYGMVMCPMCAQGMLV